MINTYTLYTNKLYSQSRLGSHNEGINTRAPWDTFLYNKQSFTGLNERLKWKSSPDIETISPKITNAIAGSFSRLNNECGSSLMNIKPGKIYDRGIAAKRP